MKYRRTWRPFNGFWARRAKLYSLISLSTMPVFTRNVRQTCLREAKSKSEYIMQKWIRPGHETVIQGVSSDIKGTAYFRKQSQFA